MLGHWEIIAVIAVILLIFGPSKLPVLGRSMGEGVRNLMKTLKGDGDGEQDTEKKDELESGDKKTERQ